jgi:hypothetical protein
MKNILEPIRKELRKEVRKEVKKEVDAKSKTVIGYNKSVQDLIETNKIELSTYISSEKNAATTAKNEAIEAKDATITAKNAAETARYETITAKNEAVASAALCQKIYNDVFGASTTKAVNDSIRELKQPFTTMQEGFNNLNPINPALFDLEKDLINEISEFNTTYYNYIRCSTGGSQSYCSTNVKTIQDVQNKSTLVNNAAKKLEDAYNASPKNTDANFKNNHKIMMEKAKSIDELRRSLDTKMDTIIKSRTPPNELTQQYDSTVYTGIMWSVLATSVLFYVFTEM